MSGANHLSALDLDLVLLDESHPGRAHLESCAQCRGLFEEAQQSQNQVRATVLPRTREAVVERAGRERNPLRRFLRLQFVGPLVAAAAAVALVVGVRGPAEPDILLKGGPSLQLFARKGDAVVAVGPETVLGAGDRVRFVVDPGDERYLIIASIDSREVVSIYFPSEGTQSGQVPAGKAELPGSIELDDAPGTERVFALFSREPLALEQVKALLASGAEGLEGLDARVVEARLSKEPR